MVFVHFLPLGVGNNTDKSELDMIASKPTSQYSFEVKDGYGALAKIKNILAYKTCKGISDICDASTAGTLSKGNKGRDGTR